MPAAVQGIFHKSQPCWDYRVSHYTLCNAKEKFTPCPRTQHEQLRHDSETERKGTASDLCVKSHLHDVICCLLSVLNHVGRQILCEHSTAALRVDAVALCVDHLIVVKQVPAESRATELLVAELIKLHNWLICNVFLNRSGDKHCCLLNKSTEACQKVREGLLK